MSLVVNSSNVELVPVVEAPAARNLDSFLVSEVSCAFLVLRGGLLKKTILFSERSCQQTSQRIRTHPTQMYVGLEYLKSLH